MTALNKRRKYSRPSKASRRWFILYKRCSNLWLQGESATADIEAADENPSSFKDLVNSQSYLFKLVINKDGFENVTYFFNDAFYFPNDFITAVHFSRSISLKPINCAEKWDNSSMKRIQRSSQWKNAGIMLHNCYFGK